MSRPKMFTGPGKPSAHAPHSAATRKKIGKSVIKARQGTTVKVKITVTTDPQNDELAEQILDLIQTVCKRLETTANEAAS